MSSQKKIRNAKSEIYYLTKNGQQVYYNEFHYGLYKGNNAVYQINPILKDKNENGIFVPYELWSIPSNREFIKYSRYNYFPYIDNGGTRKRIEIYTDNKDIMNLKRFDDIDFKQLDKFIDESKYYDYTVKTFIIVNLVNLEYLTKDEGFRKSSKKYELIIYFNETNILNTNNYKNDNIPFILNFEKNYKPDFDSQILFLKNVLNKIVRMDDPLLYFQTQNVYDETPFFIEQKRIVNAFTKFLLFKKEKKNLYENVKFNDLFQSFEKESNEFLFFIGRFEIDNIGLYNTFLMIIYKYWNMFLSDIDMLIQFEIMDFNINKDELLNEFEEDFGYKKSLFTLQCKYCLRIYSRDEYESLDDNKCTLCNNKNSMKSFYWLENAKFFRLKFEENVKFNFEGFTKDENGDNLYYMHYVKNKLEEGVNLYNISRYPFDDFNMNHRPFSFFISKDGKLIESKIIDKSFFIPIKNEESPSSISSSPSPSLSPSPSPNIDIPTFPSNDSRGLVSKTCENKFITYDEICSATGLAKPDFTIETSIKTYEELVDILENDQERKKNLYDFFLAYFSYCYASSDENVRKLFELLLGIKNNNLVFYKEIGENKKILLSIKYIIDIIYIIKMTRINGSDFIKEKNQIKYGDYKFISKNASSGRDYNISDLIPEGTVLSETSLELIAFIDFIKSNDERSYEEIYIEYSGQHFVAHKLYPVNDKSKLKRNATYICSNLFIDQNEDYTESGIWNELPIFKLIDIIYDSWKSQGDQNIGPYISNIGEIKI